MSCPIHHIPPPGAKKAGVKFDMFEYSCAEWVTRLNLLLSCFAVVFAIATVSWTFFTRGNVILYQCTISLLMQEVKTLLRTAAEGVLDFLHRCNFCDTTFLHFSNSQRHQESGCMDFKIWIEFMSCCECLYIICNSKKSTVGHIFVNLLIYSLLF